MLEVQDLHAFYGKSHVVQGVSLEVGPGEAVGLMGRNGVGKTTTLKSIAGLLTRTHGRITLGGAELSKLSTHDRAERGRQLAGTLSGGQQKMLGLARGLCLRPKVLLVDEPSEGLMPVNVELIAQALKKATQDGLSILVVDASFDLVQTVCARMYAMDRGVLVGMYRPAEFSRPEQLAATFLGDRAG